MNKEHINRRQFLRPLLRWAGLTTLLAGYALAARRHPGSSECSGSSRCRGCALFTDCNLPAAHSARKQQPVAGDDNMQLSDEEQP